jgi:cation diffusion facilitator family transporter
MSLGRGFEFPPDKQALLARARRLEWWSLAYLITATAIVALVLGQSQAMKTAWFDDVLNFVPVVAFLICGPISQREPNERFPYGYHRVTSAAYLGAAVALFTIGGYLFAESAWKLVTFEHPTIGSVELLGHQIWLGWLMIPALVYSLVPAIILGRLKVPIAEAIYDKTLYTDAKTNKADWLTEAAAILGVLSIGLGFWWADAMAAIFISFEILRDGYTHLHAALFDLLDHRPRRVDGSGLDPVVERVEAALRAMPWVRAADVRLRVSGHTLFGEAFVVPASDEHLTERVERAIREIRDLDWRLHHFTITPVEDLAPEVQEKTS